jgi:hypothetical protein
MSKVTNDSGRNGSFQRLSARLDVTEAAMQRGAYSGTRNISGFSEFGGLKETVDGLRVKMNALSAVISGGGGSESLIANFEAVSNAFKRAQALLEFDFNKRQSDSFGFGAGLSATQIWEKARTPKVLESAAMVGINKARKDFSRDAFIEETGPRADAESANRRSRLSLAEAMADVRRERIHADRLRAVGTVSMGTGAADIPKLMATAIQDAQKAALENTKAADDSGARMATLMQQDYDRQQAWDKQVLAWRTEDNTKKRALLTQLQDIWSTITGKDSGSPAQ